MTIRICVFILFVLSLRVKLILVFPNIEKEVTDQIQSFYEQTYDDSSTDFHFVSTSLLYTFNIIIMMQIMFTSSEFKFNLNFKLRTYECRSNNPTLG